MLQNNGTTGKSYKNGRGHQGSHNTFSWNASYDGVLKLFIVPKKRVQHLDLMNFTNLLLAVIGVRCVQLGDSKQITT